MKKHTRPGFTITKRIRGSRARLCILTTQHGSVLTPAYVIVATHGSVRTLSSADVKKTRTQLLIANTYHLWNADRLRSKIPTMTDSGGFQVFSLGAAREQGVGKVLKRAQVAKSKSPAFRSEVRISEKGVHFMVDGKKRFLSPEISMQIQRRLGADIVFAFDECTSPLHSFSHTKRAMDRTHRWAARCLKAHTNPRQMLFGIVQGGRFKRLREKSARTIGAMAFDGFGIGGSYGKDEMRATLNAVICHLPDEKPRHLLGIGTVADIFDAVEAGVDTFDCVVPTREARHGRIYTDDGAIDVRKIKYARDGRRLLSSRSTIGQLHRLFRAHDLRAGRLATLHNVSWFNHLLEHIRTALSDGSYRTLKRRILSPFSRSL